MIILNMLYKLTSAQDEALKRARTNLRQAKEKPVGLGEFTRGGEDRAKLVDLLGTIMGETRLARSFTIPDADVKIKAANLKTIDAKIREFPLKMDMALRPFVHVRRDWECPIHTGSICKSMA